MITAVDPGATSAVAIYAGGPTPAVTTIVCPCIDDMRLVLRWCVSTASERGEPLEFVIEDQHAKIRWVPNPRTGKPEPTIDFPALAKLLRNAERWVVAAELEGVRSIGRVLPNVWQGPMLANAPTEDGNGKALDTAQRARLVVAATWTEVCKFTGTPDPENIKRVPVTRLNEHVRDAMLLGRWQLLYGEARSSEARRLAAVGRADLLGPEWRGDE